MNFKSSRGGNGKPNAKDRTVEKEKPLSERLSKFDYETSNSAINILVELKAKTDLRKIAETGSTKKTRISAIKSLVEIDDKDSIPILEEIIRTESWQDDEFIIVIETDNKVYKVGPPVTDHNEIEEKIDEIIKLKEALWRENASKEDRKVIDEIKLKNKLAPK